jgi:general secretion pathway protein M
MADPKPMIPQRWKTMALVMTVLVALYFLLIHWWFAAPMISMGQEVNDLRVKDLRYRVEANQRGALEKKLNEVRLLQNGSPRFLTEANKELASAALVQRFEQVVTATTTNPNACLITSRTPTDNAEKETFQRVTVRVGLRCGMTELSSILYALEGGSPELFVDNIELLSRASFNSGAPVQGANVEASFDLYGYIQAPPAVDARGNGAAGSPNSQSTIDE